MKIAFDYQVFLTQRFGGISRYFVKLAEQLERCKHSVKIFTPIHQNHYLSNLSKNIAPGYRIPWIPGRVINAMRHPYHAVAQLQMDCWKPDIVHRTYYDWPWKENSKFPIVITVHDMIHELFPEFMNVNDNTAFHKKNAINNAQQIICISENTKKDLIKLLNVDEKKISVVHHGVDRISGLHINSDVNPVAIEHPYILFVGSRGGYKNFLGLLESVAKTPRLKKDFHIVAFGGGKFYRREQEAFRNLGLSGDRIHHVSGNDCLLQMYYKSARAFVNPSLYEGFGLTPLEAMAVGCPVVSSDTSSMPEVIGNAAEFFNPKSSYACSDAIQKVVYSDDRRADLIDLGYKRVVQFSWKKCAQQTLNVYKKIH